MTLKIPEPFDLLGFPLQLSHLPPVFEQKKRARQGSDDMKRAPSISERYLCIHYTILQCFT